MKEIMKKIIEGIIGRIQGIRKDHRDSFDMRMCYCSGCEKARLTIKPDIIISDGSPQKEAHWVKFPSDENWDRDTEIRKSGTIIENEKERELFEIFLKQQHTIFNKSGAIGFTKPFVIWQREDGTYDTNRFKDYKSL